MRSFSCWICRCNWSKLFLLKLYWDESIVNCFWFARVWRSRPRPTLRMIFIEAPLIQVVTGFRTPLPIPFCQVVIIPMVINTNDAMDPVVVWGVIMSLLPVKVLGTRASTRVPVMFSSEQCVHSRSMTNTIRKVEWK